MNEQGDRSFSFCRKPGADLMPTAAELNRELIAQSGIFHFGSASLTDDPCRSAVHTALQYARRQGKVISCDPNYRPLLWDTVERCRKTTPFLRV